jgi:hypothetical protein
MYSLTGEGRSLLSAVLGEALRVEPTGVGA